MRQFNGRTTVEPGNSMRLNSNPITFPCHAHTSGPPKRHMTWICKIRHNIRKKVPRRWINNRSSPCSDVLHHWKAPFGIRVSRSIAETELYLPQDVVTILGFFPQIVHYSASIPAHNYHHCFFPFYSQQTTISNTINIASLHPFPLVLLLGIRRSPTLWH